MDVQLLLHCADHINACLENLLKDCNVDAYTEQQKYIDHVKSTYKTAKLFLILSFENSIAVLNSIHGLRQVDSVFIYSSKEDLEKNECILDPYSKIISIYYQYTDLVESIRENIDLASQQTESFKFYEEHQKSTRDLLKEAGGFLWLRLFKDVILHLPHDEKAKSELIDALILRYRNNRQQLKQIEHFAKAYETKSAIQWYTGQPFLYKQLNRALRTEDISLLYSFRYFIYDLSKELQVEYQQQREDFDATIKLYRGTRLSKTELNMLDKNVGNFLSTNGYVSTSMSDAASFVFTGETTNEEEAVVFEIEYDFGNIDSVIVASISHLSAHNDEEEFLFDFDATFQLQSVTKHLSLNLSCVKMKAVDHGSALAKEYVEQHRRYMNNGSVVIMFGYLLIETGEYEKAKQYFERLLSDSNEDSSFIYYYLGTIENYQGDYEKALNYYQISSKKLTDSVPSREGALAFVLNDTGTIFKLRGQYDVALGYYSRALAISEGYSNCYVTAAIFGNIGIIYGMKGDYDRALHNQMQRLQIQEQNLPSIHRDKAKTLNNIATIFTEKDELNEALEFHEKSLLMNEQCLPAGHIDIATSIQHIGSILTNQGKFTDALEYYLRALSIRETNYPNGHIAVAASLSSIGRLYYLKQDYDQALFYLEKSLKMKDMLLPDVKDTVSIDIVKHLGLTLIKQHEPYKAMVYLRRALRMSEVVYPSGHKVITDCWTNLGIAHSELKQFDEAFENFTKAQENVGLNSENEDTIRLARIYDNMGISLCKQENHIHGLKYRMMAVRLIDKVHPRRQYALWIDTVGTAFFDQKLFDAALECYLMGLNMKLECIPENDTDIAESLMRIGDVYFQNSKMESKELYYSQAIEYYEMALEKYKKSDHENTAYLLNCIGSIYENLLKYDLALQYYSEAYTMFNSYFPFADDTIQLAKDNITRVQQNVNGTYCNIGPSEALIFLLDSTDHDTTKRDNV